MPLAPANTNDGTEAAPRLRCYMNLLALEELREDSAGPRGAGIEAQLEAICAAGYEGVQFVAPASAAVIARAKAMDLGMAGSGRVNESREADPLAAQLAGEGLECGTVHLGWGMEDENEGARLIEAMLCASERRRIPLYVETHRATLFQDLWRTVQFVARFPELRFNGDFSHWYTGLEMVYGGFERKMAFIEPAIERVRFVHGRIGNPGCIQVDIGNGDAQSQPYVGHFRQLWTAVFRGFLAVARAGDYICFTPELLAPRIYYGRVWADASGTVREESDRWAQSFVLARIARECFESARQSHIS